MKVVNRGMALLVLISMLISVVPISDVYGTTSAEKLNELGLLLNVSEEELEAVLTREIGLTMILKALGYTDSEAENYGQTSPFIDTERWSKGWVALAYHLGITTGTSQNTFSPNAVLSEKEFLTFLLRALGYDSSDAYNKTSELSKSSGLIGSSQKLGVGDYDKASAANAMYNALSAIYLPEGLPLANMLMDKGLFDLDKAISVGLKDDGLELLRIRVLSNYHLQVVFNKQVDISKMTFSIKDEVASYGIIANWDESKTLANLIAADKLVNGNYTLVAKDLSGKVESYSLPVNISTDNMYTLDISGGAIDIADPVFSVVAKDKYDTVITDLDIEVAVTNVKDGMPIDVETLWDGTYRLKDGNEYSINLGDEVRIMASTSEQKSEEILKIVDSGQSTGMKLLNPILNNGRLETSLYNLILDYQLITSENALETLPIHIADSDGISDTEFIGDFIFTSTNPEILDVDTLKVNSQGVLRFNLGNSIGTTKLTVTNSQTGNVERLFVTVYGAPVLSKVSVEPMLDIVTVGEEKGLNLVGYDQFGAKMNISYISGLEYQSSRESVVDPGTMRVIDNKFFYTGKAEGISVLSIYNKDKILLFALDAQIDKVPEPLGISDINIPKLFEASDQAEYRLTYDDVVVIDQYGREYDLAKNRNHILISHNAETENVVEFSSTELNQGGVNILGKSTVGIGEYTFVVENIPYAAKTIQIETIEKGAIATYTIENVLPFKHGAQYQKIINLKGYDKFGREIVLANNKIDIVTFSLTGIASGLIDGNQVVITGEKTGVTTMKIWNGNTVIAEVVITIID